LRGGHPAVGIGLWIEQACLGFPIIEAARCDVIL